MDITLVELIKAFGPSGIFIAYLIWEQRNCREDRKQFREDRKEFMDYMKEELRNKLVRQVLGD